MKLNPYLIFDGDCKEAFAFYQQVLGGTIVTMMTNGESPIRDQVPKDQHDRVLHVTLDLGHGDQLQASDAPPGHYAKPQGFVVSYSVDTVADAQRIFAALVDGGTVSMPIAATFWSAQFGMGADRFGIPWMVNCALPAE